MLAAHRRLQSTVLLKIAAEPSPESEASPSPLLPSESGEQGTAQDERAISFSAALEDLRACVGAEHVVCDRDSLDRRARSTLPSGTTPRAIVRPACSPEVQGVVRIANRHGLALYPISTGKNWGYGDACAATSGQILLDLGRMNRIVEVNTELAYATVEPGVTQGQLAAYLEAQNIPLWADATGAGPGTSLIGNTLERGIGHTPHGDRFLHSCGMEVVLADGRILKTGFGHYCNAQATQVFKWGVGPYLDGLFTQSNLGIVTRMTFWLLPKPEAFRAFFFALRREEDLGGLVEALRPLRLRGTLTTPIHIGNDLRVIAMAQAYPWEEMEGRTPLSPEVRANLRKRHGVHAWCGSGALYGSFREVAAAEREVKKTLHQVPGITSVHFFDDHKMKRVKRALRVLNALGIAKPLGRLFGKLEMGYELLKGRSPATCVQGGLWRARSAPGKQAGNSSDPLDFQAGFIALSPVLPMSAAHVERINRLAEPILNRHGFDYQVTFSMVTARALCAVLTISFDKRDPQASREASAAHDELLEALILEGYVPYRMSNASRGKLDLSSRVFFDVTNSIKSILDPKRVLSPGNYEPLRTVRREAQNGRHSQLEE